MKRKSEAAPTAPNSTESRNFIQQIVEDDLKHDRTNGRVMTRFPPEPNGFLHIGHAKAIAINFGIAAEYGGVCNLRFDDTNPETEDMAYVQAIKEDIRWLGFDWGDREYFASDYFDQLYEFGIRLIEDGKAFVDSLNEEEIREYRGTVTRPGKDSPHRTRSIDDNLDLFRRMRNGEFPDGAHVLRAKIDMSSNNMLMRDPVLYRIKHVSHYRRGNDFPIYPMYDLAHPLSDAIEGITHSFCTLEFEVHRALYDWLVDAVFDPPRPHQYEFARFNLDYTVMSKRKLLTMVEDGIVDGWDDPRMPTLAGFRRRGVTPEAILNFAAMIGVAKAHNRVDIAMLEYAIRDDLNAKAPRVMCVLRPLRVIITNYPDNETEWSDAPYWPHDIPKEASRPLPFSREIFIEQDDFQENPERNFHRLAPGSEVRLRYSYIICCEKVIQDADGAITELHCTYDKDTRSGSTASERRVKGTIHWVSASEAIPVQVRLYDRLFAVPDPEDVPEGKTFVDHLNPDSLKVLTNCLAEPSVKNCSVGDRFQFERQGYFIVDKDSKDAETLVFNRTISLRDTWATDRVGGIRRSDGASKKQSSLKEARTKEKTAADRASAIRPPTPVDPLTNLDDEQTSEALRLEKSYGIPLADAALISTELEWIAFFEKAAALSDSPGRVVSVANWIVQELRPALMGQNPASSRITAKNLVRLVSLQAEDTISRRIATEIFGIMLEKGGDPQSIMDEKGLRQISDNAAISEMVVQILAEFPDRVTAFKGGKKGLIGFFVGQVMQRSKGKANPKLAQSILLEQLRG